MKITSVKIDISHEDLLSIVNEFLNVTGLKINELIIEKNIIINGRYENKIGIDFQIILEIVEVRKKKLIVKLSRAKVSKLALFRPVRSLALKKIFQSAKLDGLYSEKDKILIDLSMLLKDITFLDFDISDVYIKENVVKVEIGDINFSMKKELIKSIEEEKLEDKGENYLTINKVQGTYNRGRRVIKNKLPKKINGISDYVFVIPDLITLICRLLKDKRVSMKTKLVVSASLTYTFLPHDLIPDKIPFIGKIDDLAVLLFALDRIAKDIPNNVILENWAGDDELIDILKVGLDYIKDIFGVKNVEKLYNFVEEVSTL